MAVYIALLRGINVGGKNKIKMAELKKLFESLGFKQVQTYIQSGNVVFESDADEQTLRDKLDMEIETAFGLKSSVVLRTAAELESLIKNCPFSADDIKKAESSEYETLYTALLSTAPLPVSTNALDKYATPEDRYKIIGRDIYLLTEHSIRDSKLASRLQKQYATATVRNLKTIKALFDLANKIEIYI